MIIARYELIISSETLAINILYDILIDVFTYVVCVLIFTDCESYNPVFD